MLTAERFPEFFQALHGRPAFPWQIRLATHVLTQGRWPDVLDLPTGAGKTSTLDIALFATASDPTRFPRRVVQVVDRRVVVDQGAEHARRTLTALHGSTDGVLFEVAERLRVLWGGPSAEPPFIVAVMRGAMPRDESWAKRPDQPVVALSTVDQAGSRILFRGYGVSSRMSPIHAGLLGNDTLFLLDEVHIAVPFAETLVAIRDRWRKRGERRLPDRWAVVRMSATPGAEPGQNEVYTLDADDRQCPALARRLGAHKRARLKTVSGRGETASRRFVRECIHAALEHVDQGARTVAVVVNRVNTARQIRQHLDDSSHAVDAVLLTGRMRPLDRDGILDDAFRARVGSGRDREVASRPLVVVATQCVEVGADFDFDALVTECAALDALRQRFGRLDRLGELGESRATIIIREEQVGADDPDPVYGSALDKTWGWLTRQGDDVDFGIDHVQLPHESELTELLAPTVHAPVLLPSHLDSWIQTSPKPTPDPEVSLWLHGPERGSADVQIVWRADMTPDVLAGARHDNELLDELQRQLVACPPGTLEALSVPLGAVRAWLAGETAPELTDVVGGMESEIHTEGGRPAVCWRGDRSQIVVAAELSPGDTIVVPASYGGLRFGNWVPGDETVVRDLGDLVQWKQRGRPTVRLHPAVLEQWLPSDIVRSAPGVPPDDALDRVPTEEINTWLRALPSEVAPPMGEILAGIRPYRRIGQAGGWWTLLGRGRSARSVAPTDATGDDDASSFIEREVTLAGHCLRVQEAARASGLALCLPDPVVDDLALAGWLHDVGKADPRFQRMLVGGSEVRLALLAEPLAKSSMPERDLHSRRVAWERSNLPAGYRHELVSVSLLAACPDALCGAHDPDLVLFLIGGHHGWGRPFAPPVDDPSPVEVDLRHGVLHLKGTTDHRLARLDSGLAERFFDLVERYGWWGLAWLEAIFQLADHRVSEDEEVSR